MRVLPGAARRASDVQGVTTFPAQVLPSSQAHSLQAVRGVCLLGDRFYKECTNAMQQLHNMLH